MLHLYPSHMRIISSSAHMEMSVRVKYYYQFNRADIILRLKPAIWIYSNLIPEDAKLIA